MCLLFFPFLFGPLLMPEICLTVQPPEPFPVPELRLAEHCSLAGQSLHQLLQHTWCCQSPSLLCTLWCKHVRPGPKGREKALCVTIRLQVFHLSKSEKVCVVVLVWMKGGMKLKAMNSNRVASEYFNAVWFCALCENGYQSGTKKKTKTHTRQ